MARLAPLPPSSWPAPAARSLCALLAAGGLALSPALAQDTPEATEDAPAEAPSDAPAVEAPEGSFVAVVVGVSSYASLPDEVHLDFARSDAATVASALADAGHYDQVFLLTDREATREAIRDALRTKAAQHVGPDDTLLFYFVGHGLGAELGISALLAHDSTLEGGDQDGLDVTSFAQDIATWTRAGTTILVTDAIHKNQLDGIPFHGPAADQWPGIGPNTLVVSAASKGEEGKDGLFGIAFADALSGAADIDGDTHVTATELSEYLSTRFTNSGQSPALAGTYAPQLVLATGVTPGATVAGTSELDPNAVYGDYRVFRAKFYFPSKLNATVQCRDVAITSCPGQCYVWDFLAGPCKIETVFEGEKVRGVIGAFREGLYTCDVRADRTIGCVPPASEDGSMSTGPAAR